MDKLWIDDISILFKKDRIHEFWPNKQFSVEENINSISRFCLYCGLIFTFFKNDPLYIVLALCVIFVITKTIQNRDKVKIDNPIQPSHIYPELNTLTEKKCTTPTKNNPFANVNYFEDLSRPSACTSGEVDDEINTAFFDGFEKNPYDIYNNKHSQRQFFSVSSTTVPNDQDGFAKWLYGGQNNKKCKENAKTCTGNEAFGSG